MAANSSPEEHSEDWFSPGATDFKVPGLPLLKVSTCLEDTHNPVGKVGAQRPFFRFVLFTKSEEPWLPEYWAELG